MKNRKTLIMLLAVASLGLAACNSNNGGSSSNNESNNSSEVESENSSENNSSQESSSESSSELPANKVAIETSLNYLNNAIVSEALKANGGTLKSTSFTNERRTIEDLTHTVFKDKSSYGEGRKYQTNNGQEYQGTNFKTRTQEVVDKVDVNGEAKSFSMFSRVVDYEDETISSQYEDRAEKAFIVANKDEAQLGGLQEGEYIIREQYPIETSMRGASSLKTFILSYILGNPTASQYPDLTFTIATVDGVTNFACDITYSYKGDGTIMEDHIVVDFDMNEDKDRLLNGSVTFSTKETRVDDETDFSVTGVSCEMTLSYGDRVETNVEMDVHDYFLEEVTDIQFLQNGKNGGFVKVDADKITIDTSYIRAEAKTFTPAKAISKTLVPVSSSNLEVVKIDKTGYMEVVGLGKTTLKFTYSGKVDDVYKQLTIEKEITVNEALVDRVYIVPSGQFENNTINVGDTYEIRAGVLPSEANQEITVSVDNANVLEVAVSANGFKITGKAAGTATVTVTSVEDTTKSNTITFKVLGNDIDYKALIVGKLYKTEDDDYRLEFNANGTGVRTQTTVKGTYRDSFNYTISKNVILFSGWKADVPEREKWETCAILNEEATILKVSGEWYDDEGSHPYIYELEEAK